MVLGAPRAPRGRNGREALGREFCLFHCGPPPGPGAQAVQQVPEPLEGGPGTAKESEVLSPRRSQKQQ
eukprot:2088252-Pyramimonas_sp.AAC.1